MAAVADRERRPGHVRPDLTARRGAERRAVLGNRATAALLGGETPWLQRAAVHPEVARVLAGRRALQRWGLPWGDWRFWNRPRSKSILSAYGDVSYDRWFGHENVAKVWGFLGGRMRLFSPGNSCAARLSYALNNGGDPITGSKPGWIYPNRSNTKYRGEPGDGKNYIVSAAYMRKYLTAKWGKPDAVLKTIRDAADFRLGVGFDQVAVFAGVRHAGLITRSYMDPYVFTDPKVLPVAAWKLPEI